MSYFFVPLHKVRIKEFDMYMAIIVRYFLSLIFSFSLCAHNAEELFYQQFQAIFLDTSSEVDLPACEKLMEELTRLLNVSDD